MNIWIVLRPPLQHGTCAENIGTVVRKIPAANHLSHCELGLCIEYISQERKFNDFITGDLETSQKSIT